MKANLCKCLNCGSILIDQNPQINAPEFELNGAEKEMQWIDKEGGFWACPVCDDDGFLVDFMPDSNEQPAPPTPQGEILEGFTGGELLLSVGMETDSERVQLINQEGQHIGSIEFYPLKETADTIINSVNNYPTLYRENKRLQEEVNRLYHLASTEIRKNGKLEEENEKLKKTLNNLVERLHNNWDAITSGGQNGTLSALTKESETILNRNGLMEKLDSWESVGNRVKFMFGNEAHYEKGTVGYNIAKQIEELLNRK